MEVPIELCQSAKVYKSDPIRRYVLLGLLLMIYAFSIPFCYYTAGEPRKAAMIAAQKLADEKWALESSSAAAAANTLRATDYMNTNDTTNDSNTTINDDNNNSSSLHGIDNKFNDQLLDIDKANNDNSNNNYDDNFISLNELSGTLVEMDSSGLIDIDSDTNDIFNANNNYIGGAGGHDNDDYNSKLGVKKSMGSGNHHEDEFDIDHVVSFDSSADTKGYDTTTITISTTNTTATTCNTNTFHMMIINYHNYNNLN